MSRCRKFTRRAAIGLLTFGSLPSTSRPLPAFHIPPQCDGKSLEGLLTSIFLQTYQQLPFFDSCRGVDDENNKCLDTLKMNIEALIRAGHSAIYIQDVVKHNISNLIWNDFQESNVVVVDGWVLSKIETAICSVISKNNEA
jgi:hypothetical protein